MQLIKDFTDISRFVSLLKPEYQQKLLNEINNLVVTFMDEQTKSTGESKENTSIPTPSESVLPFQQNDSKVNPVNNQTSVGLNALKNSFASKTNIPPPPQILSTGPMQMTRSITAGTLNFKTNVSSSKPQNKKMTITLADSWAYIIPELTSIGQDELKNPNTKPDLYQLLKQIDGQSSLKEIFLFLHQNSNVWAKFLGNIYPLYRERSLNLKKQRSFPTDVEIPMKLGAFLVSQELINESDLEKALEYQKNPPVNTITQSTSNSWADKAISMIGNDNASNTPNTKKKLGEVLIELKLINKEELDNTLALQKWIKNIIEHS
jgi:hypothetical protein